MKEWVLQISAISLQRQAVGNMNWGRLPGNRDVVSLLGEGEGYRAAATGEVRA